MNGRPVRKMRKAMGKYWPWFLFAVVVALWAYSLLHADFDFGRKAGKNLASFLVEMASVLPPMFLLVGLFEIWVPKKVISATPVSGLGCGRSRG